VTESPVLRRVREQFADLEQSSLRNDIFLEVHSHLRWGWVFLERTRILSGIQFTTYFIEIFAVETKRFVGSFVHVILTRQTFGQRSSRAAESKRRALGNYFPDVPNIKMQRRLRSRAVHHFGTCVWRTAAQWQNPNFPTSKHDCFSDFAIALRFSKRKHRSGAQT